MKNILPILFVLFYFNATSQTYPIEWGDLQRANGRMIYMLPNGKDEFYALRWSGGRLIGSYQISKHKFLQPITKGKVKLQVAQSIANFEGLRVINNELICFLSDIKEGKNTLYMQKYSEDLILDGEAIELASYSIEKGMKKGWFEIKMSANEKFFGVVWEVPGRKSRNDVYGFRIFDINMELINDGEYPLPFASNMSKIHEHHISNNGEYFLAVTEYLEPEKKRYFSKRLDYKSLHIFHIAEDGLQDFELSFKGNRVDAMEMSSDTNGIFTITGLYGVRNDNAVKGIFHQLVDVETSTVLNEGFQEFDPEFIVQGWSDRQKRKANRRQNNGRAAPQLYNYSMRDVILMPDSSLVGTMEQYYVQVSTTTNGQTGQTTNTYFYYYNDIIAYKISAEGQFDWIKKVRKYQVSQNDGGPYSSYESFVDDGKIYFIFNDNAKNYSESGDFIDNDFLYTANYSKRRNAVAIANIDLKTGVISRKTFFDRSEVEALAMPKLFDVNYEYGNLLLYTVWGRKEKIGVLKFKD
ncbi:hypothetical protein OAU25_00785 [Crocinitomicaceae bacterium]|nr:hypothetical protein [Crocinitomicaceae bacterium]